MEKYAIIDNAIVINVTTTTPEFAQEQGWVLLTGGAWIGWGYVNGQFVPPPPYDYSQQNKDQATALLSETDWTATVDISNPTYSNPYLANQNEFLSYRSQVRQIAINPPVALANFPTKPEEVWVSV